ncbi:hypothetical protein FGO68_gene4340 [Halteria grandinella]|uniref:Uncharacterized protein n=1 Tax=Halteria grandinella TaxID=5974 RepID=A0A8J8T5T5_HALGN|nr:hypothetical protein FGO68_gene4340 [Halteria grandinella]
MKPSQQSPQTKPILKPPDQDPNPSKIPGQRMWKVPPPIKPPRKIISSVQIRILKDVCHSSLYAMNLELSAYEQAQREAITEELVKDGYHDEHREKAFEIVAKGMGRVLDCMHDILGREDFTRLVDKHKTIHLPIEEDLEEKKELPQLGDEIPEEIEAEDDNGEIAMDHKLPGEEGSLFDEEKKSQLIEGDVTPDTEIDYREQRDALSQFQEALNENVRANKDLNLSLKYFTDNIRDLRNHLKGNKQGTIDEQIRKQLSLLCSIEYFPYNDLASLKRELEITNQRLKDLLQSSTHLFKKFGDSPDVFSLHTLEALVHLQIVPREQYEARQKIGEVEFPERPEEMGPVEVRLPTKMKDGDVYFGEWQKGAQVREGKGIQVTSKEGKLQVWIGWTFKRGVYGESLILQKGGSGLFGNFNQNSKLIGLGVKLYDNGDRYEGDFKDGKRNGAGTYWHAASRDVYDGNWLNNQESGSGVLKFGDGGLYEGEFSEGKFHGKGNYTYPDGRRYEGEWAGGKPHGQGVYYYTTGDKVYRTYSEGKLNGRQKYLFSHTGVWETLYMDADGKQTGPGKRLYPNGDIYDGEYVESKKHGEGILTRKKDGSKERRKYVKGRLQETTELTPQECMVLTRPGGWTDKVLILSYFDDPYLATSLEARKDVYQMVKKKEHADNVWFTLLAIHVYTGWMQDKADKLQAVLQAGLIFCKQNWVTKPDIVLKNLQLNVKFKQF